MNHLGDTNKMVSDTPRTDVAWKTLPSVYDVIVEMKRIERELNAANDRIKRLEEGGDRAILNSYLPDRLAVWNEAKEAKP